MSSDSEQVLLANADNFVITFAAKYAEFESKIVTDELLKIEPTNAESDIMVKQYGKQYGKQLIKIKYWSAIVLVIFNEKYDFTMKRFSSGANLQLIINALNEVYEVPDGVQPSLLYNAIAAYRELIREIRSFVVQIFAKLSTGEMQPQFAVDLFIQIPLTIEEVPMLLNAIDADVLHSALTELICSERPGVMEALVKLGFTPEKTVSYIKSEMDDCIWLAEKKIKNFEECIARITKAHRL